MDYKIIEKEAFEIIEKVETFSVTNGENLKKIPEFWTRSHEDGTVRKLLEKSADDTYIFGICYANSANGELFDYSIAAVCDKACAVPKGFRKNTVPARTWIAFTCKGAMPAAIQELWEKITTEFFPTSEYAPTCEMDIEAYTQGDMDSPDYVSEIWIPVRKKS